jgi:hypothetical protein
MSEPKNKEDKQPSLFGIPFGEKASDSSKNSQLFGISIAPIEDSNSTTYYETPAITQSLNLLELTLKKNDFDKSDFETLRATLSLLPITEISRLRTTVSLASLDNLAKKADIYEKTQLNENTKSTLADPQQENKEKDKDLEALALNKNSATQDEMNKLMSGFLNERNDLNQNMEEKNKQLNQENSKQNNLTN